MDAQGDLHQSGSPEPMATLDIIYYNFDTAPGSPVVAYNPDIAVVLLSSTPRNFIAGERGDKQVVLRTFNAPVGASASGLRTDHKGYPDPSGERTEATDHGRQETLSIGGGDSMPNGASWDFRPLMDRLKRDPWLQFLPDDGPTDENDISDLNRLCHSCQYVCDASRVLNHRLRDEVPMARTDYRENRTFIKGLRESFELHPSGASLLSSALRGCHLCTIVCQQLFYEARGFAQERCNISESCMPHSRPRLVLDCLWWHRSSESGQGPASYRGISLEYKDGTPSNFVPFRPLGNLGVQTEPSGGWAQDGPAETGDAGHLFYIQLPLQGHRLRTSTASDAIFALAERRISECRQEHPSCRAVGGETQFRPTRLLDVGPPGRDPNQPLRLSLKTDDNSAVEYLALSYCWGTAHVYKLTSDTFDEMSRGFPVSVLSQTLQDAVKACKKLKQRYIWIDSLCILQDSDSDWRQEAAQMSLVFTHALCTIAAVCAEDSSKGFFRRRNPRTTEPLNFPTKYSISLALLSSFERDWGITRNQKEPLFRRAWVLQERLLSARILRFEQERVIWECQECLLSEDAHHIFPGPRFPSRIEFGQVCRDRNIGSDGNLQRFFLWWCSTIRDYTSMEITKPRDRFPAFYGILSAAAESNGMDFFDGLPVDCFLPSLLWVVSRGEARRISQSMHVSEQRLCTSSIVNTLSWASVEGNVMYTGWPLCAQQSSNVAMRYHESTGSDGLVMCERKQNIHISFPEAIAEYNAPGGLRNSISRVSSASSMRTYNYTGRLVELKPSISANKAPSRVTIEGPTLAFTTECTRGAQYESHAEERAYWSHPLYERRSGNYGQNCELWFWPDLVDLQLARKGWKLDVLCLTIIEWGKPDWFEWRKFRRRNEMGRDDALRDSLLAHATGLVLVKGPEEYGDVYTRVGYFEHKDVWREGDQYARVQAATQMRSVAII